jgi:hypothetical protein
MASPRLPYLTRRGAAREQAVRQPVSPAHWAVWRAPRALRSAEALTAGYDESIAGRWDTLLPELGGAGPKVDNRITVSPMAAKASRAALASLWDDVPVDQGERFAPDCSLRQAPRS